MAAAALAVLPRPFSCSDTEQRRDAQQRNGAERQRGQQAQRERERHDDAVQADFV